MWWWWLVGFFALAIVINILKSVIRDEAPTAGGAQLRRITGNQFVVDGLSIKAEVLFRTGGPGTHEWHDLEVLELRGDFGETGWAFIRTVMARDSDTGTHFAINILDILEIQDRAGGMVAREIRDIARWLRLMAGGINERDAAELAEFHADRKNNEDRRLAKDEARAEKAAAREKIAQEKQAARAAKAATRGAKSQAPDDPRGD